MFRFVTIVVSLFLAGSLAADDAAWHFNGEDAEGWKLGPRTANLRTADGKLQFDITGRDPWITSPPIDMTVTPQTRLIIRMSSEDGAGGQLYWMSVGADGKALPYGQDRVAAFPAMSDENMHEYYILPRWEGRIKQIRIDPPGERGRVAIDSIRIQTVEIPLVTELRCEFTPEEAEHWVPEGMRFLGVSDGVLNAEVDYTGKIGATLKGLGLIQSNDDGSGLIRTNLQVDTQRFTNVAVRMSVTEGTLASIRWYSTVDPGSHASWQDFFIRADGRFHTYNLDLKEHPTWKGTIQSLEVIVNSRVGTMIGIDYVRIGKTPDGPPLVDIGYLSTERVLYKDGDTAKVRCLVRNDGGAQASNIKAIVQIPGVEGEYEQITQVPSLDSGQACEVQWNVKVDGTLAALLGGRAVCENGPYPTGMCRLIVTGPRDESQVVGNERVRLAFTKNSYGYGPAYLEMNQGIWWQQCGVLPSLGEIVYKSKTGRAHQKLIFGEGKGGRFKGEFKDCDGVAWVAEALYTPEPNKPWIKAEYSISANADREILAFRGPMLYAGEGSFGAEKEAALFPGLEWLVKGERSSNWLDGTPPRSNKWVPDPYKVTIPMMAVLSERKLVGLMWNALDRWDGENKCVSANFLSPNYHEGQKNHAMSLFVPSIPHWVLEDSLLATRPYSLKKGKKLTITCYIFAQEADDILQAVKNWFEVYGAPALQNKPRGYEEELGLCMEYFNSTWDEKEACWRSWRGTKMGPGALLEPYLLYLDSKPQTATAQRAQEILDKVMAEYEKTPHKPFALATAPRCWPVSELPFRLGRIAESLRAAEKNYSDKGVPDARPGIALQRDDGSWGFTPKGEVQKLLGKEGESESGICARAALPILTYARITGDERFSESGMKALKCLDRFSVPRAAQVWEVPAHTPDILASAYALMCYLEGYKITGRREYLDKAIRWGYAGLPFVYAWGVEDRPVMPFAGIAVYGCSFYVRNCWIGRPVQWCSLDYAVSLQELARYDDSFPWKRIAEGVTISAMCQQSDEGEFKGRYPDSWILRTDERCWAAMLDPNVILQNVLMLTNRVKTPETEVLRTGGSDVRVTSLGKVEGIRLKGGILSFDLRNVAHPTTHVVVAGLQGVEEIQKDGATLPKTEDTDAVEEGWEVIPESQIICLKLKTPQGGAAVQIRGAAQKLLPLPW